MDKRIEDEAEHANSKADASTETTDRGAGIIGLGTSATSFFLILDLSEREASDQFVRSIVSRRTNPTVAEASSV
jgi:ribose 5-phosphate isomerase